jgi:outer membrane protein TolC
MVSKKLLTCGISALALSVAGCGLGLPAEAPVFDPRLFQRSERAQARLDTSEQLPPLPTTQENPLGGEGLPQAGIARSTFGVGPTTGPSLGSEQEPLFRLSLQQAVQRAVLYNHLVKVAGYQPAIDASRVTEAEGLFDPVFFSNLQFQRKDDETAGEIFTDPTNTGLLSGTTFYDKQDIYEAQAGFKRNLESGGQIQLSYDSTYNELIPQRYLYNPFYENKVTLQLTQPLLRNFGSDVNQARIFISRNDARKSLLEFRKTLEENISKLEEAYWQLVQAQRDVQVEESLLQENEASYKLQLDRVRQNIISSLEVSQVQTSLNARQAALIRAKANARNLSDQLKQLMNDPNLPVSSPVLIVATDDPVEAPMSFDIEDQITSGEENRYELGEQLFTIDDATITYGVARNNTLPKMDFVGSVSPTVVQSNYGDALSQEAKFGHYEWSLGLQIEVPIGNREALSILRRTMLQREQAIEQYAALVSQVALDVKQATTEVDASYRQLEANRESRLAAQRALGDIVERQQKGTEALTPEFVQLRLQLADQLAQQGEAENEALANYNIALERLERAKGTLLRYNNILMEEEPYKNQGLLR